MCCGYSPCIGQGDKRMNAPLTSLAPVSTKVAQPQVGQVTMSPISIRQTIYNRFWRFWPRRNPLKLLQNQDALREQPFSSYPLEYGGGPPVYAPRVWNPKMGGNSGLLQRGYKQTWDTLPLPPRVVPLIMQGGKPSVVMGTMTPQRLSFKNATNPQRIPPIYVQNI